MSRQNVFDVILESKKAFLDSKNKVKKKIGQESVFDHILERKKVF